MIDIKDPETILDKRVGFICTSKEEQEDLFSYLENLTNKHFVSRRFTLDSTSNYQWNYYSKNCSYGGEVVFAFKNARGKIEYDFCHAEWFDLQGYKLYYWQDLIKPQDTAIELSFDEIL